MGHSQWPDLWISMYWSFRGMPSLGSAREGANMTMMDGSSDVGVLMLVAAALEPQIWIDKEILTLPHDGDMYVLLSL